MFSRQSPVTVTAVAQLSGPKGIIPSESLVYDWRQDDQPIDSSGYGKRSVTVKGNFWGRDELVSVRVSSLDNSVSAEGTFVIKPIDPEVVVYEENPLLGTLFNRAVAGTFSINKNSEVSFFAAPYNFVSEDLSSDGTAFNWQMNGDSVSKIKTGNTITFRDEAGVAGVSRIGIDVSQAKSNFQNAGTAFSINFK